MNLSEFSVRRPVLTSMVTAIVVLIGIFSLLRVQVDLLPTIELPTITIRTQYDGASPEVMERLVTQILEEIIATVPGVVEMTSQSSDGNSNIRVTFGWGTTVDAAALDLQSRIEAEIDELPEGIVRPRVSKFDIASFPVVVLGISSTLDPVALTELIENQLRYRFSRLPGVAQVDLWGGYPREIRIELHPDRIRALQLPLNTVLQAIRDANLDLPAGEIEESRHKIIIRAPAEFRTLKDIEATVLAIRNGAAVTLGQVATVADTYEKITRIVRVNGERGIQVAIRKQSAANTVDVAQAILAEIDAVNRAFPQIHVVPAINQGNFIERSIDNVATSVLYGGALAIAVLLFFLLNFRSTLIIAVSIPVSIIATFSLIYLGGFTLNLMTLGGLALGVGMMVDSSIVVLENIFRRRKEMGEEITKAAIMGAKEVSGALVASTLTTLVVFLPLVFVRGVSGILFQELAYVVSFSLVCALLVSLSVVPVLASKILRRPDAPPRDGFWSRTAKGAQQWTDRLNAAYTRAVAWALKHRAKTIVYATAALLCVLALAPLLGTDFMPPSDEGEVQIVGEMEIGTRLDLVDKQTRQIESIVYPAVPEAVASVVVPLGTT
ncbi:MAG: efflux RND transporter permease subunit [Myxococcota bacterium]